jgi:predicted nuclease of predicted toxin-antitoxin system
MKVLADENIPLSAVKFLRAGGHDVATLLDIGKTGIPDSEVVEIAEKDGRIILTLDIDFGHIYYFAKKGKVNVIVLRPSVPIPENVMKLLENFLKSGVDPRGLVIVSEKKIRTLR